MSFVDEKYYHWYNVIGGPATVPVAAELITYHPADDRVYYATEYEDGWTSVDGDEWFGEFPSRAEAEAYLGLVFTLDTRYDDDHG